MAVSLHIKRLLGSFSRYGDRRTNKRIILIYHAVGSGPISLPADNFMQQMDWLTAHASVESLESLIARPEEPGLRVALTFDDGYLSVYSVVAPVLAQHGFPATVYLNTGMIGEREHCLSNADLGHYPDEEFLVWPEVAELDRTGWTIGSHGVDHVDLTKLPEKDIMLQLKASRDEIEKRLGRECRHFCYTWGLNNLILRKLVKRAGYLSAVAAIHGPLKNTSDCMALERIDVRREYCLKDFIAAIQGDWDYLAVIQRLRRIGQK